MDNRTVTGEPGGDPLPDDAAVGRFTPYGERFEEALQYAARTHAHQRRKGTSIPYITHLLAVAAIVGEHDGTETEVIAALLHDAVEDQGGASRLREIRERFGEEVAAIVQQCSDTDQTPKPPWRERKEAYIGHLAAASPLARLVSAADKLHNARAILADYRKHGDALWSRFNNRGRDDTLWYYRELVRAYKAAGTNPIVEELDRVVGELDRLVAGHEPAARPADRAAP